MRAGRVAILDRYPARRQGIIAALEQAGLTVDHYADDSSPETDGATGGATVARWQQSFISWALSDERDAVLIADHAHLDLIRALHEKRDDLALIALVPETSPQMYCRTLQAGATGAIAETAELDEMVAVLGAALRQRTVLPTGIAHALVRGIGDDKPSIKISRDEGAWLKALVDGSSIATLAQTFKYSQRQMHRLLQRLYGKLGASNRSEALVRACRAGLID